MINMNRRTEKLTHSRGRVSGFTLIELSVALFLAVFLMVGVAEIFKISTQTASRTEAMSDTYQMARGVLSTLADDLSQAAPDGYFHVLPQQLGVKFSQSNSRAYYRFDGLFFTAVGSYRQMGEVNKGDYGAGAQIYYGPGVRQAGSGKPYWREKSGAYPDSDQRGVLLVRKAYVLDGQPTSGGSSVPTIPMVPPVSSSSFAQMAQENVFNMLSRYRIKPAIGELTTSLYQKIDVEGGAMGYDPNIDFLLADRVSEFFVEVWGFDSDRGGYGWLRPYVDTKRMDRNYIWTLGQNNPQFSDQPTMPELVRVTIVMHPHSDLAPLNQQPYASQRNKFKGDVFRRVIRLPGPIAR